ncbi:MAG: arylesterase [Gammaproteobacteria bacterium]
MNVKMNMNMKMNAAPHNRRRAGIGRALCALAALLLLAVTAGQPVGGQGGDKIKLLIVGDSLSSGYGLPAGKGWVNLLAKRLRDVDIVNDSISGDTTAGGAARLPAALRRARPDWVIIELGGNDGLRGGSLAAMKNNLRGMVDAVRAHGAKPVLFGMKLPPNYGLQYTRDFAQVYAQVAAESGAPLLPFFLRGLEDAPHLFQRDRIHPNAAAQPLIERNVREFLRELW